MCSQLSYAYYSKGTLFIRDGEVQQCSAVQVSSERWMPANPYSYQNKYLCVPNELLQHWTAPLSVSINLLVCAVLRLHTSSQHIANIYLLCPTAHFTWKQPTHRLTGYFVLTKIRLFCFPKMLTNVAFMPCGHNISLRQKVKKLCSNRWPSVCK